jgi:hypothetical protein
LTIDTSQNVGIGTTTPATKLDVQGSIGAADAIAYITDTSGTGASSYPCISYRDTNGQRGLVGMLGNNLHLNAVPASSAIIFKTVNTEVSRIDSSGNFMVGQTSPTGRIGVTGTGSSNIGILGINATDTSGTFVWASNAFNSGMTAGQNLVHFIGKAASSLNAGYIGYKFSSAGSSSNILTFGHYASDNLMNLDGSGNLGLGVTPSAFSAGKAFQIAGTGLSGSVFMSDTGVFMFSNNYRYNGGDIYNATGYATRYYQYAGQHIWNTAPSGTAGNAISFTQAMTLDNGGRLLLGTTSSYGTAATAIQLSGGGGTGRKIDLYSDASTHMGLGIDLGGGPYELDVYFADGSGSGKLAFGKISPANPGVWTELVRIDSEGRLGIKQTPSAWSTGWGVVGIGSSAALAGPPDTNAILCANAVYGGSGWVRRNAGNANIIEMNYAGSSISTFTSGSSSAGSSISYTTGPYVASGSNTWTNGSDARLKNITGEIQNGLAKVMTLRAAEFTWKHDADNKPCVGLIAQDVQAVLPEAVDESSYIRDDETKYLGVNYDQTIPLLVAAIKEQQAIIQQLQADVAALKGTA